MGKKPVKRLWPVDRCQSCPDHLKGDGGALCTNDMASRWDHKLVGFISPPVPTHVTNKKNRFPKWCPLQVAR